MYVIYIYTPYTYRGMLMILWLLSLPYPRILWEVPCFTISQSLSSNMKYKSHHLLIPGKQVAGYFPSTLPLKFKTSHSCLNYQQNETSLFFAFLDHVHNFHDHGNLAISNSPSTHKLGPTSVGVMTWSGSDRISCSASEVVFHSNTPCTNATGATRWGQVCPKRSDTSNQNFVIRCVDEALPYKTGFLRGIVKKNIQPSPTRHQFYMPNHNRKFTMELVNSIPRRPKRWSSCPCSVALSPSSKDEITEITLGGFCHVSKSSAILEVPKKPTTLVL